MTKKLMLIAKTLKGQDSGSENEKLSFQREFFYFNLKWKIRKTEKKRENQRKTKQSIYKLIFFKKAVDKVLFFNYNNDCRF